MIKETKTAKPGKIITYIDHEYNPIPAVIVAVHETEVTLRDFLRLHLERCSYSIEPLPNTWNDK